MGRERAYLAREALKNKNARVSMAGEFGSPIRLFVSEEDTQEEQELLGTGESKQASCAGGESGAKTVAGNAYSASPDALRSKDKLRGIVEYTPDLFSGRKGHLSSSEVFLEPMQQIVPEKEPEMPEKTRKKQVKVQVVEQEKPQQRVVEQAQCENNNIIYAQYLRPVELTDPADVILRLLELDFWVDLVFFMGEVAMPMCERTCQECHEPECENSACIIYKYFKEIMGKYFQAELSGESNINIINFLRDKCPGSSRSIIILNKLLGCELLENTQAHRDIYKNILNNINIYILNIADKLLGGSKIFWQAKNFLLEQDFFGAVISESNKLSKYFEQSEYISAYDCRDFFSMASAANLFSKRFCEKC